MRPSPLTEGWVHSSNGWNDAGEAVSSTSGSTPRCLLTGRSQDATAKHHRRSRETQTHFIPLEEEVRRSRHDVEERWKTCSSYFIFSRHRSTRKRKDESIKTQFSPPAGELQVSRWSGGQVIETSSQTIQIWSYGGVKAAQWCVKLRKVDPSPLCCRAQRDFQRPGRPTSSLVLSCSLLSGCWSWKVLVLWGPVLSVAHG